MADNWDTTNLGDDEEQQNPYPDPLPDVILFAIDCSSTMVAPRRILPQQKKEKKRKTDDEPSVLNSHLFASLCAATELMKRKALYEPRDSVGILLFNTMESDYSENQKRKVKQHMMVLQGIGQIDADAVHNLLSILNDVKNDHGDLERRFRPWKHRVPIGDVFLSCNWLLREHAPHRATKRIFFITDEDDPHDGNAQLDRVAKQNLADLYSLGATIEPFFITTEEKPFSVTAHYSDILSRPAVSVASDDPEERIAVPIPTPLSGFKRILSEISIREAPKRAFFHITMTLGENFEIGVKGYGLVVEMKKQGPKWFADVNGELKEAEARSEWVIEGPEGTTKASGPIVYAMSLTTEPAAPIEATQTQNQRQDLDEPQSSGEVAKVPNYFTEEEVAKIRSLGLEPGIRILGFKDADSLAFEDNVKHSWFIYPSEAVFKGSTRTFSALLKALVKKEKIGIALGLLRRNSLPRFYAMVPQEEVIDNDGLQERPPGFHMIPLPYADDIRAAPVEESLRAGDDLVQAAAAWINEVRIKKGYNPDSYPNPTLRLFNSQLEALALREEFQADEFDDRSAPMAEEMVKRAGELVETWKAAIAEDPNVNTYVVNKAGRSKRKADVSVDELRVRELRENGHLGKLTVEELKAFLKTKNIPVSDKKKAGLLEAAEQWLVKNPV